MPRQFKRIVKYMDSSEIRLDNQLDADITIEDLVTLLSRETTHTAKRVEGRLLTLINSMLANYTPKEDE